MAEWSKAAVLKTVEGQPSQGSNPCLSAITMNDRGEYLIKVLVVDDHDLVRSGVKKLLSEQKGIEVVGDANSGEAAVKAVHDLKPDVILMDVKMPGIGGLGATRKIMQSHPEVKIIIVTACGEEPFPTRLLQAGALGYLTKGTGVEEMVTAIRKVHSGQRYLSPEVAQELALKKFSDNTDESMLDKLSDRELQVMLMISSGLNVQAISEKLHLSPKTVNSYRYRLFEKLNIKNDVELTHIAIRHGLLEERGLDQTDDQGE